MRLSTTQPRTNGVTGHVGHVIFPSYRKVIEMWEHKANWTTDQGQQLTVSINKVGGGEVGRFYPNENWEYAVELGDELLEAGDDFYGGIAAKTHYDAACFVADFFGFAYDARSNTMLDLRNEL